MPVYNPGDIIYCQFSSAEGHEQAGFRPALVLSDRKYQSKTGLHILAPITTRYRSYPTRIKLDERTETKGYIIGEQIKSVDLKARKNHFIECCPSDLFEDVLEIVAGCFPNMYVEY